MLRPVTAGPLASRPVSLRVRLARSPTTLPPRGRASARSDREGGDTPSGRPTEEHVVATTGPRVLSAPPRHDYVDRLHGAAATLVHRGAGDDEARIWDPGWVAAEHARWDVAHLHFGWEGRPVTALSDLLEAHAAAGTPVVWTAHDLRNPHTTAASDDDGYLAVLARHAAHVVTLTDGAADEVARRFDRRAEVVPHGPILPVADLDRWRAVPRSERPTVLLNAKSFRRNLDVEAAVDAARELADGGGEVQLVVGVHDEDGVRERAATLAGPGVHVDVHRRWSLDELCHAIRRAHALLLPYRWGSHSGLLELAADLGTPVIATTVGFLAEQHPTIPVAVHHQDGPAVEDLRTAFRRVADAEVPDAVPIAERAADLDRFRDAHRRIYAELAAGPRQLDPSSPRRQ